MEEVLRFLHGAGQFQRLRPRLIDDLRARDAALNEGRAARVLEEVGFRIVAWDPPSPTGNAGDLEVEWPGSAPIFVEVKGPDWQSELSPNELRGARKSEGKWVDLEARSVGIVASPLDVTRRNALKKFTPHRSNLVVIVDDLFVSPAQARGVIESRMEEFFREAGIDVIGGILFVKADYIEGRIRYFINFYENPTTLTACQLPPGAVQELVRISELQRADQDSRYPSPLAALIDASSRQRKCL